MHELGLWKPVLILIYVTININWLLRTMWKPSEEEVGSGYISFIWAAQQSGTYALSKYLMITTRQLKQDGKSKEQLLQPGALDEGKRITGHLRLPKGMTLQEIKNRMK